MSTQPFPLSLLCDVTVSVTSAGVTTPTFNQGIVVGDSGVIPSVGDNSRTLLLSLATWQQQMVDAGFSPTDPEYIAMGLYFGVDEEYVAPQFGLVGCQDPTAIGTVGLGTTHGAGYVVGELVRVTQAGAQGGVVRVSAVNAGVPTAIQKVTGQQGTAYAVANDLATVSINGAGAGLEVDITTIGETPLEAIMACRAASPGWYTAMSTTAIDADHLAIAAYAQTAQPAMQYVYGTSSASALNGTAGNIFSLIKTANYSRAHGAYSTTQGGAAPNNAYIAAAIMGIAMGDNTGLPNSNFVLSGKTLAGITPENSPTGTCSLDQAAIFSGIPGSSTGNNGNGYFNYGNSYNEYQQGVNGNGSWFDQILGLDMLAADMQISVLNAAKALGSIPQDDAGQMVPLQAAAGACARSSSRGFLATGIWTGATILKVSNGTPLQNGYQVQSAPFSTQTSGDRALRKGMPIIATVILAGSQQSFAIGVNVQQ